MTALIVVLSIVLLLVLICFIKLDFSAQYSDTLTLKLKILFLSFTLVPAKEKVKKQKKKAKKKKTDDDEEKKPYVKKLSDKKGLQGLVSMLSELAKLAYTTLKGIMSKTVITKFDIKLSVAGDDAADTALKYGKVCSVFYPAVTIICESTQCKDYSLDVAPDFSDDAKTSVCADFRFHIRLFYVLWYLIKALTKIISIRYKR